MTKSIRQRRLSGKTDYKARLALLKSGKPRLVVRKTNRYMIAQIISSDVAQDKVVLGLTSKDLIAKGWPKEKSGSLKSLTACYLLGLMLGNEAKAKTKEAILDSGMYRNIQKSRLYSVLKGVVDSGLKVPCNEKSLPKIEEINKKEDLKSIFNKMKDKM